MGVAMPASYLQSSGFTNAKKVVVGASPGIAGNWTQTGGNVLVGEVLVGGAGNGDALQSGGTATYSSLRVGTAAGITGSVGVTGDAQLTVTGSATFGEAAQCNFHSIWRERQFFRRIAIK